MALCGETRRNWRNIYVFSLLIFLRLLARGCHSAPTLVTQPAPIDDLKTPSTSVSLTTSSPAPTTTAAKSPSPSSADVNALITVPKDSSSETTELKQSSDTPKDTSVTEFASSSDKVAGPTKNETQKEPSEAKGNIQGPTQAPPSDTTPNAPTVTTTVATTVAPTEAPTTTVKVVQPTKALSSGPELPYSDDKLTNAPSTFPVDSTDPLLSTDKRPETTITVENDPYEYDKDDDEEDDDDTFLETDNADIKYEENDNTKDLMDIKPQSNEMDVTRYNGPDVYNADDQDSHFFFHLVILAFLVAIAYITYHNKRKILLLAQSRRWKDGLCSRNTVEYHRLDQNVNEAMPSLKMTRDYVF
ncbi:keratinocyte-associated transmembrane protein 2 [Cololabis saira]|uniref:keratinocyte-associated transmembrane protein 2 n=1 Tax=Cololabis saira TaxID=129043 RepID=UPI002AD4420D|nr:keratinocyte-associated transmembrane protein 2 [Cololabis saira]